MTGADDEAGTGSGPPPPSWLHEACPAWCAREHREEDHPEDRYHQSEPALVPVVAAAVDTIPLTASLGPMTLSVRLGRQVGEPVTWLAVEGVETRQPRLVLTEESGRALLPHLGAQLALAAR